jgi:molecular chaperone GrpE
MSSDDPKNGPPAEGRIPPSGDEDRVVEGPEPGSEARSDEERLRSELELKSEEAARYYDQLLRARAELDNVRKRLQREKAEALRFANEALVRDLLPFLDNLERAIVHAESGGNGAPLVEGVRLALRGALDSLERHGVRRVEATGQRFDPSRHEAVAQVPDAARPANEVVEQFLPGYLLHERLIRPAQVSVSAAPPVENPQDDD